MCRVVLGNGGANVLELLDPSCHFLEPIVHCKFDVALFVPQLLRKAGLFLCVHGGKNIADKLLAVQGNRGNSGLVDFRKFEKSLLPKAPSVGASHWRQKI